MKRKKLEALYEPVIKFLEECDIEARKPRAVFVRDEAHLEYKFYSVSRAGEMEATLSILPVWLEGEDELEKCSRLCSEIIEARRHNPKSLWYLTFLSPDEMPAAIDVFEKAEVGMKRIKSLRGDKFSTLFVQVLNDELTNFQIRSTE